jgi:phenylalanine-4-hydroxylase
MTFHLLARPHHPAAPASGVVWKMLFDRQQALLHRWARPEFGRALAELGLRRDTLPNLTSLSQLVYQRTGWTLLLTGAPVAEAVYYAALARRELPVVSRLRTFSEFDQPPSGPDLFADVFGRLPLLLEPGYAEALQALGQAWELATTPAAVALLRRFAQATFELGLLAPQGGRPQFYGATLLTAPRPLHAVAAAEPAQYQPLAGAARQLSLSTAPTAGLADSQPTYFVAQNWAELSVEIQQLRAELRQAQRPEVGSRMLVAPATRADGRAHAFAARLSGPRQAG